MNPMSREAAHDKMAKGENYKTIVANLSLFRLICIQIGSFLANKC